MWLYEYEISIKWLNYWLLTCTTLWTISLKLKQTLKLCLNCTCVNLQTKQNLHRWASVGTLSLWSLRVCVCVRDSTLAPESPRCPVLLCLLNQMVSSFLAVPGHFALQHGTQNQANDWLQRERESTQSQPLFIPSSPLLSLLTSSTLHASSINFLLLPRENFTFRVQTWLSS